MATLQDKALSFGYEEIPDWRCVSVIMLLGIIDLFGKKDGEGRIRKDEHNRELFLTRLKTLYIDQYNIKDELINNIYHTAKYKHEKPIEPSHDHATCDDCIQIMKLIKEFNKSFSNNIERGAHTRDWMGS